MNINVRRTRTVLLTLTVVGTTATVVASDTNMQTLRMDPKVAGFVKQGGAALRLNQYDLAIRNFTAALRMKPDTKTASAIHDWRAGAYGQKGELNKAMEDADESIRLNPAYFGGYLARGIVYRRSGNLDQAISDYNTAIRLNPNFARTYYDRAIAYARKGDYNEAIRDSTEAIRHRDPTMQADFYYNRAAFYQAVGSPDKAMADYNEAIRLAPKDLRNFCGRAKAFEDMGQFDKASADYDLATRFSATNAPGYLMRGYAHFAKGTYRAAASDFQKAARLSPRDYDALLNIAWFQATCPDDSLRNGKDALEKSKRGCELSHWQDPDAVDTLAAAYTEIGDFDDAVKYETQAINMKGVYATRRREMQERLELYRQNRPYRKQSKLKAH